MIWSTVLVLGLAQLSIAKPLAKRWDDFSVKHSWSEIPRGWELHGPAPADHTMDMRIGLKQDKLEELIATLYEVSDPAHEKYGQHLSAEEAHALAAPHPDSLDLVDSWLTHHEIDPSTAHRSGGKDWVTIKVSVTQAERMLGTKYNVYHHSKSDEFVVRTMGYSLPKSLHGHVDVVAPTTYFGTMRSMRATNHLDPEIKALEHDIKIDDINAAVPASCSTTITPSCLRTLYNTASYVPKATSTNKLGVAGYLDEYANRADLQTFFKKFRTDAVGGNFTTEKVSGGGDDQSDPGVEANLDIQYTEAISYPTPNIYYSTGGSPPYNPDSQTTSNTNEPYLDWLNYVLAKTTIPQTFTTSYGDDEQTVPIDYANKVCDSFAQLGARGASILFSSGDFGVGGGDCKTNDGKNTVQFQPAFPASCPYVTTVGGTYKVPEVAVSFSGGGFSNYYATPSYQANATASFLTALGTKYAGKYNKTGRAYPDVAAQGQGFQVVIGGSTESVGGTSASSPTFAAIISLLNDYRLSNGKASLGFLNPFLYSTGAAGLNDITSGSNPGCSTNGFTAAKGWDPVTGLGTPDFVKLQALV